MPDASKREALPCSKKTIVRWGLAALAAVAAAALVVVRFDDVLSVLGAVWQVLVPLLLGAVVAYLLNLVMARWESVYFPNSESVIAAKTRRPVCLLLSVATVGAVVALIVFLVSSEIKEAFAALGHGVVAAFGTLAESGLDFAGLASMLPHDAAGWQEMAQSVFDGAGGATGLLTSVASAGGQVAHGVVGMVVALVFGFFVLVDKERVVAGAKSLASAVLSERAYGRVSHAAKVADDCFSRFISGQCIEAVILGCLCALGLKLFGFPYAAAIGLCVGATSLVPLVGAWVGGIVGALMILSVSPMQAVWFVVFLLILQQIEGHLIYPNVVGTSVGVPGIWVLVAVFVGGSLFGIAGVLLGVPVVATVRRLVFEYRAEKAADSGDDDGSGTADARSDDADAVRPPDAASRA